MRKVFSLLMMMVFSVFMFAATKTTVYYTAPAATIGTYTVKLNTNQQTNPDSWFTYTMTKTDLSYNGDPVYTASFTDLWDGVAVMQIQLYDGSTWKSQKQPFSSWASASTYNGKMFVHATEKWVDPPTSGGGDTPEPPTPVDSMTVYFCNSLNWEKVNAFVWPASGNSYKAWPGEAAKKEAEQIHGVDVYSYTFPASYVNVIFNNGTVQTADLAWAQATPYFVPGEIKDGKYEGKWYAKADIPAPAVPATFYLTGDSALVVDAGLKADKAWSASAFKSEKDTFELNLHANQDYKLNLTLDGDWGTKTGYSNLSEKADGLSADADDNICFKLNTAGVVKVVYFVKDEKLTYKLIGDFYVKPVVKKELKLVPGAAWNFDDAKFAAYLWGDNGYQSEWTPFFAGAGDTLKVEINAEADSMVLVRFADNVEAPTWDNENDNIWGKIDKIEINYTSLVYTVTSYTEGTWDVYVPVVPATFYLTGDSALVVDAGLTADKAWSASAFKSEKDTFELNLHANQDYKLNLTLDGDWGTKTGYSKLSEKADGLSADKDDNICFKLNNAGVVKVVYFVKDEKLTYKLIGDFYVKPVVKKELKLVPGVWAEANAKIAAWLWGKDLDAQFTSFFAGKDTLTAEINAAADSIAFVRFADKVEAPTWADEDKNVWNKMSGDTIDYVGLTYTITDWAKGQWTVYVPEVPAKFYITGDSALVTDAGFPGKAWNPDAIKSEADTLTLSLKAGVNYQLKVTDGTWNTIKGYDKLTKVAAGLKDLDGDNHNIGFRLNQAGDVKVVCTSTVFELIGDFYVPTPHYYIAGTMNEWNVGANELVAGNGDTLSLAIALEADSLYEFKVVKVVENDTTWYGIQETAAMVYGNSTGWWLYKSEGENNQANVGLQTTKSGEYEFIFEANEHNMISVVIPEPEKKYFAKYAESGKEEWIWHAMTEKDGLWLTDTIVYLGGGMNIHESMEGDGKYYEEIEGVSANDTAYFAFNPSDSTLAATLVGKYVAPTVHYYIAGTMNEWNVGANEFVAGNGDSLSLAIALEADSLYEFKVVKVVENDTTWYGMQETAAMVYGNSTGWWLYKSEGENNQANVGIQTTKAGDYTFIFKSNENNEISVVIPEPLVKYYLKNNWGGSDEWSWKEMTTADGGENYQLENVVFGGGGVNLNTKADDEGARWIAASNIPTMDMVLYKMAELGALDTVAFVYTPEEYNSYNPDEENGLSAFILGKYVAPETPVTFPVIEIAGAWDVKEEAWVRHELVVANDSLTATYTVSLEAGSYEFKMIKDNKWLTKANNGEAYGLHRNWPGVSGVKDEATENLKLTADVAGTYTFTWTYANDSVGISFPEKSEPVLTDGFYLVGSMNEWTPAAQYLFKANPDAEGEYSLDITFAEGDDFKVVYVENDVKKDWYPGDGTDNYLIDADHTGTKTVYFRPDYQGGEDWYYHCIFVAANGGTGIEETIAAGKAAKVLRNGHFFILKGDKVYNVTGAVIR